MMNDQQIKTLTYDRQATFLVEAERRLAQHAVATQSHLTLSTYAQKSNNKEHLAMSYLEKFQLMRQTLSAAAPLRGGVRRQWRNLLCNLAICLVGVALSLALSRIAMANDTRSFTSTLPQTLVLTPTPWPTPRSTRSSPTPTPILTSTPTSW